MPEQSAPIQPTEVDLLAWDARAKEDLERVPFAGEPRTIRILIAEVRRLKKELAGHCTSCR